MKKNDHAMDALRYAIMMNTTAKTGQAHTFVPVSAQPQPALPKISGGPGPIESERRRAHTHVPQSYKQR